MPSGSGSGGCSSNPGEGEHINNIYLLFQVRMHIRPATRIRFRTPEQMKAKANTTSEQSNGESMEVGNPPLAEMEEWGKKKMIT